MYIYISDMKHYMQFSLHKVKITAMHNLPYNKEAIWRMCVYVVIISTLVLHCICNKQEGTDTCSTYAINCLKWYQN